jgi:hypothetical protein
MRRRVGLFLLLIFGVIPKAHAGSESIIINAIMTGQSGDAGDELVQLCNRSADQVAVEGWKVQYKAANSPNDDSHWRTHSELAGGLNPNECLDLSSKGNDPKWNEGMAADGGAVRLIDNSNTTIDLLGYGSSNTAESDPAPAPQPGQRLERQGDDSDDNSRDFKIAGAADQPDQPGQGSSEPSLNTAQPAFSEFLINPAAPLTDASDEFVELYNPGPGVIDLSGYQIRTGSNMNDHFELSGSIGEGEYLSLPSSQTHLSLVNSGDSAELLDPSSNVIDSAQWPAAEAGYVWAKIDGSWEWSMAATPGRANELVAPVLGAAATKPATTKNANAKSPKAAAKPKTKASAKATKPKSAKTTKAKAASPKIAAATNVKPASWLIIVLAVLTIGYAIYEFRYDIRNFYLKLRGNRKASGAGGDSA